MAKYRKKSIVIEAIQIKNKMTIETLEGTMTGEPGDWLLFGIEGEAYFCKDSIFRQTYELVEGLYTEPVLPTPQQPYPIWPQGPFYIGPVTCSTDGFKSITTGDENVR